MSNNYKALVREWFLYAERIKETDEYIDFEESLKNREVRLYGRTYDNKNYDPMTNEYADGHRIITSPVINVDWGTFLVTTESGSVYKLDGPEGNLESFYGGKK